MNTRRTIGSFCEIFLSFIEIWKSFFFFFADRQNKHDFIAQTKQLRNFLIKPHAYLHDLCLGSMQELAKWKYSKLLFKFGVWKFFSISL